MSQDIEAEQVPPPPIIFFQPETLIIDERLTAEECPLRIRKPTVSQVKAACCVVLGLNDADWTHFVSRYGFYIYGRDTFIQLLLCDWDNQYNYLANCHIIPYLVNWAKQNKPQEFENYLQ